VGVELEKLDETRVSSGMRRVRTISFIMDDGVKTSLYYIDSQFIAYCLGMRIK
jgi:hypothetical protein